MDNGKLMVTSTPHIRAKTHIQDIMLDVIIALAPAAVMGAFYFGFNAVLIMLLSVGSCVLTELLYQMATKQKVSIGDLSAVVTGMLLAFNLPASVPLWLPVVGGAFAIVIVKQLFGGLGQNFMNPALAARAFLLAAYPSEMTNWSGGPLAADAVSAATPLAMLKNGIVPGSGNVFNALIGNIGGCIGETCAIALLIGGVYLIARRVISWKVPVVYLGTVFVLSWVLGRNGLFTGNPLYEVLTGGLMLGAFFMATDYASSPVTPVGRMVMGLGCGVLTVVIRHYGSYPEGVSYSILLMNLVTPLLDKFTQPKIYGGVPKRV